MSIIMGSSVERGRYGSKLMLGQSASGKYPGFIDCGEKVFRKPSVWRDKNGRERSCNYYYVETSCANCEMTTLAERGNARRNRVFCSRECRSARRRAENAGRRVVRKREHGDGHHVLVKTYDHPRSSRSNQVYEHVLVAEQKLGRDISPEERVHHINLIKNDNRPENLFVCSNNTEHLRIHGSLNLCVAPLIEMGAIRFDEETRTYEVVRS